MDDVATTARFEAQLDDEQARYERDLRRAREVYARHIGAADTLPSPPPNHIVESEQ